MDERFKQEVTNLMNAIERLETSTEKQIRVASCLSRDVFEVSLMRCGNSKTGTVFERERINFKNVFTMGRSHFSQTKVLGTITFARQKGYTEIVFSTEADRVRDYCFRLTGWITDWLIKTKPYFETKIIRRQNSQELIIDYLSQYINIEREIYNWAKTYTDDQLDVNDIKSSGVVKRNGYVVSKVNLAEPLSVIEKMHRFSRQELFAVEIIKHNLIAEFTVLEITLKPLSTDEQIIFQPMFESLALHLDGCYEQELWVCNELPKQVGVSDKKEQSQPRGAREKTLERVKLFKKIKDANLSLSYGGVAMKATTELEEKITPHQVRYAYKKMGWKWIPGDKAY